MVNSPPPDRRREQEAKPVPPQPHRFVAEIDTALKQEIVTLPRRQRIYIITARRITF